MKTNLIIILVAGLVLTSCKYGEQPATDKETWIKPWKENTRYWQYKGKPVLLLGGTCNDNLFQNQNLKSHLDSLKDCGGNYIRNTMSDRDPGNERAFMLLPDGKYDLGQWNEKYWAQFEKMLTLTSERDIIVQIEIWDRFDHSRNEWLSDPYNPENNLNYTYGMAGLDSLYPLHPGQNVQPFFFTIPALGNNEVLLKYQRAFVKKLLDISLRYDNVLYCIDNETSGTEEWATYWADFIKENSNSTDIYITQMWDTWDVKADIHKRTLDHPERYGYIDLSQNSQITGYQNWENARYVFNYIKNDPRPVNSTKIYGSDQGSWLNRGINTSHGVQTFFRNLLGGFASSRFHRPPSGLGLSELSINCIKTVRKIEKLVKLWDVVPRMDLLQIDEKDKAFLAAREGEAYLIYFTGKMSVKLDLTNFDAKFILKRVNISDAEWEKTEKIKGGGITEIRAGNESGSLVVLIKK